MPAFILRRIGVMLLTALALTFIVFTLTNLEPNLRKLAKSEGSVRMEEPAVQSWLEENGFKTSMLRRYGEWLGVMPGWTREVDGAMRGRCIPPGTPAESAAHFCGILQGEWGWSTVFKKPVTEILSRSLGHTAWLMLWVMIVMVPTALTLGVLSGMREGSRTDRVLSTFAIASTATPEYVSGVIFVALLASATAGISPWLSSMGWIEGRTLFQGTATSAMDKITFWNFGLPVMTIALYGIGYIARMTRASMTEVMTQQYIRTARLKGVSFRQVGGKARAAQRADRPLHGDHAAVPLASERRRHRGNPVQLQGLRLDASAGRRQQRHQHAAGLFGRGRAGRVVDTADLGRRLCLPEPPHPAGLRRQ